jgi:hypothetical protein
MCVDTLYKGDDDDDDDDNNNNNNNNNNGFFTQTYLILVARIMAFVACFVLVYVPNEEGQTMPES